MSRLIFDDDIFSQNLKYYRNKSGISQKELALRSGINVFLIRGIERGRFRAEIPLSDYRRLCQALDISPDFMGIKYLP